MKKKKRRRIKTQELLDRYEQLERRIDMLNIGRQQGRFWHQRFVVGPCRPDDLTGWHCKDCGRVLH